MNARRGWVRAQERGRVAVARELACVAFAERFGVTVGNARSGLHNGLSDAYMDTFREDILDGSSTFDVHRVREHARSLIALEAEQAAFEDWTRAQGKGPENRELGAFAGRVEWRYAHSLWARLGAEGQGWAWMGGKVASGDRDGVWFPMVRGLDYGGWPGKLARQWGGDSRAPMGRAYARLGRRILGALDGQPDACQGLAGKCKGGYHEHWGAMDPPCPDCRGTGHNLRGVLAPIEWSPQTRRRNLDSHHGAFANEHIRNCWLAAMPIGAWPFPQPETRVVPRGDHRTPVVEVIERDGRRVELRDQARGWIPKDSKAGGHDRRRPGPECWPRWKHGEHSHSMVRQERALDRQIAAASLDVVRVLVPATIEPLTITGTITV